MRTIRDILDEIDESKKNASESFLSRIVRVVETSILSRLLSFLDRSDVENGRLKDSLTNEELLVEIQNEVDDAFIESGIEDAVEAYTKDFDLVESLQKEYFRRTLTEAEPRDITALFRETRPFKTREIDTISKALLSRASFQSQITNQYRDILFDGIVFEKSIDDIKAEIREAVRTSNDANSPLHRYASQVSRDTISQYEGTLQETVRNEYDLDGFAWTGSTKAGTRSICADMTCAVGHPNYTGRFDDLKLEGIKGFRVADIPEIIRRMRSGNSSGLNAAITPETFAKYRGGYHCEHSIIYFRLTEEQRAQFRGLDSALED